MCSTYVLHIWEQNQSSSSHTRQRASFASFHRSLRQQIAAIFLKIIPHDIHCSCSYDFYAGKPHSFRVGFPIVSRLISHVISPTAHQERVQAFKTLFFTCALKQQQLKAKCFDCCNYNFANTVVGHRLGHCF